MNVTSIVDYVKGFLEKSIVKGDLLPGQRIKEENVASRLGISRPPIREAFKILEAEGLITRKIRRGVFVSEITEKDIWEIYTLKAALYSLAASLTIEHMSERGMSRLETAVRLMGECANKEPVDFIEYEKLNANFHNTMADMSRHQRLQKIIGSLRNQIKRLSYKSFADAGHLSSSYRYHKKILDAIKRKDKELAERLTREHVYNGMKVMSSIWQNELHKTEGKA